MRFRAATKTPALIQAVLSAVVFARRRP